MSLPIEETVAELANGDKPLLHSRLVDLSNLNSEELGLFEQARAAIEPRRRRQIMYRLVELAENNFELNFDGIFTSCLKDDDVEVRCRAIEGLWESEDASLINPLINLLGQDSSEKVQATAATALGRFTLLAELRKLRTCYTAKLQEALLAVFGDKSRSVEIRRRALEAVAPLNIPQVQNAIMEAYRTHNSKLRVSSIYAMGKHCNHFWLPMLLKELANANTEIRYEAAGACGELGEEEAVPYLIELIKDPDADVQMAAIQALGKIGGTDAKECLQQCLSNPSQAIRQAAEQALHEMEAGEAPFLFQA